MSVHINNNNNITPDVNILFLCFLGRTTKSKINLKNKFHLYKTLLKPMYSFIASNYWVLLRKQALK